MVYLSKKHQKAMEILSEIGPAFSSDLKILANIKNKDIATLKGYGFIKETDGICYIPGQTVDREVAICLSVPASMKNKLGGLYPAQFPFKLMFSINDRFYYVTYVKTGDETLASALINNFPYYADEDDKIVIVAEDNKVANKMQIKRAVEYIMRDDLIDLPDLPDSEKGED